MGLVLLLLFVTVPLVEIAVFIRVGDWIGLWPTLALILLTAVVGSWQVRRQGLATLARAREQLDRGEIPAIELFNGLCLLAAGALLLTPGFVTDLAGASLFLAPVRGWLRRQLGRRVEARAGSGATTRVFVDGVEVGSGPGTAPGPGREPRSRWGRGGTVPPGTIEGEWTELGEADPDRTAAASGEAALSRPGHPGEPEEGPREAPDGAPGTATDGASGTDDEPGAGGTRR